MKKIFASVILLSSLICAQSFQIKQITNLPGDCRNIVRVGSGGGFINDFYAFESHIGNASTIIIGEYNTEKDSFSIITNVTNDNFMNINPQLIYSYDSLYIIYQTNKNGNWDIVYNIYTNNQLSPSYYIADSSADEINPGVQIHNSLMFLTSRYVFYEANGSIFLKDLNLPNIPAVEVYHGNRTFYYSQPSIQQEGFYLSSDYSFSAKKMSIGKTAIVFKKMDHNTWGSEITISDSGNADLPEFQYSYFTYNNDLEGKKNIYIVSDLSYPRSYKKLILNPKYDYFNFKTDINDIIAWDTVYHNYFPYSYQVLRNDSLFIHLLVDNSYYSPPVHDTLIYTKIKDSKLYLRLMGYALRGSYALFYTFWEDSVNGKITILGRKTLVYLTDLKDNVSPYSFSLEQNYPNPFNPSTSIEINIASRGNVKLIVYDITGSEVCTLMNEDKMPGRYVVNFDTRKYNLSSGVYFYKLTSGLNSLVKKLVLLK